MAGSGTAHLRSAEDAVLRAEHVTVEFPAGRRGTVHAVSDVSIDLLPGETLGLVGESGCGKSTLARALLRLPAPTSGRVTFAGEDLGERSAEQMRQLRPRFQVIFQDPISSLNPRRRVRDVVGESLAIWGDPDGDGAARVDEAIRTVGLDPDLVGDRRPHEFSGGQAQRLSIARALLPRPDVLVCDEPVSALDVSIQAQILNLLEDARARFGLAMLFIAHDLAVVGHISDRVAVMYLGKLCEVAAPSQLYDRPRHPYTAALIAAVPSAAGDRDGPGLPTGGLPSPLAPPSGCRFRTRCPLATERCAEEEPVLRELDPGQFVACHHPLEVGGNDREGDASPIAAVPRTAGVAPASEAPS
jgi:peptide/nickel transport system ATP-binding protein